MSTEFTRDKKNNNALINTSSGGYAARIAIKNNYKKREAEISDLKTQIADLKAIVDGLTGE